MSAKALGPEQGWLCSCFLLEGREIEYSLLCLQRVDSGNVVAWDVALFPGSQGSCSPPLPRSEGQEEAKGSEGRRTTPGPLRPPSLGLEYPQPQEAGRVRGRATTVPAPSLHPVIKVNTFTTIPTVPLRVLPGLESSRVPAFRVLGLWPHSYSLDLWPWPY